MEVSKEEAPIEPRVFSFGEHLQEWLRDKRARDQFLILDGMTVEIYWNIRGKLKPEIVDHHGCFTQEFVRWSPLGTYLATIHRSVGPSVWGGVPFLNPLMLYSHRKVKLFDFSSREKYLVSYSSCGQGLLKIFDVKTGKLKKELATGGIERATEVPWPRIRWNGQHDDQYFARLERNAISIYETKTFSLIDDKPLRVENVADFTWSPVDPIIALFVPANYSRAQLAMVSLIRIPSKTELRKEYLIGISNCKMYWQSDGDYLAVLLNQAEGTSENQWLIIFDMREAGISSVKLELENKNNKMIAFSWEPKSDRFGIIHGVHQMQNVSFYSMSRAQNRCWISKIITLKGRRVNCLRWSPAGRFIILAGLEIVDGEMIFYDVNGLKQLASKQFTAKQVEWSPTGWYVTTSGTLAKKGSKGVEIWSFCGELLYQIPRTALKQFLWRPRPSSFLTTQNKEEIAELLEKKTENDNEELSASGEEELFELSTEQCDKFAPEGRCYWMSEWIRLHKVMDENSLADIKEQQMKKEKLEK